MVLRLTSWIPAFLVCSVSFSACKPKVDGGGSVVKDAASDAAIPPWKQRPWDFLPHKILPDVPCEALLSPWPVQSDEEAASVGSATGAAIQKLRPKMFAFGDKGQLLDQSYPAKEITAQPKLAYYPVGYRDGVIYGKYRDLPVTYVTRVRDEYINNGEFWVIYKVSWQIGSWFPSETETRRGEICQPIQSMAINGDPQGQDEIKSAKIAADLVVGQVQADKAKRDYDMLVFTASLIPGVGTAISFDQCQAGEISCRDALISGIADGASMLVPLAVIAKSGRVVTKVTLRVAMTANAGAAIYKSGEMVQDISKGNYTAAVAHGAEAIIRLTLARSFKIQMRQLAPVLEKAGEQAVSSTASKVAEAALPRVPADPGMAGKAQRLSKTLLGGLDDGKPPIPEMEKAYQKYVSILKGRDPQAEIYSPQQWYGFADGTVWAARVRQWYKLGAPATEEGMTQELKTIISDALDYTVRQTSRVPGTPALPPFTPAVPL